MNEHIASLNLISPNNEDLGSTTTGTHLIQNKPAPIQSLEHHNSEGPEKGIKEEREPAWEEREATAGGS